MRLLLTRPFDPDDTLGELLEAHGHQAVRAPLLKIEPLSFEVIDTSGLQAVIATSANALRALDPSPALMALPLYAVGPATGRMGSVKGFTRVVSGDSGAAALTAVLETDLDPGGGAVLYLRGEDIAFDMGAALTFRGFYVHSRITYRAQPIESFNQETISELGAGTVNGVVLLSPRTAQVYVNLLRQSHLLEAIKSLAHYCLSERVAAPLGAAGAKLIRVPSRPDVQELVALIDASVTHSNPTA